jgi:hypothetical protein
MASCGSPGWIRKLQRSYGRRVKPVRRLVLLFALVALASPSAASAWHYKFQDFFAFQQNAVGASVVKAKKCGGGLLGTYKLTSHTLGESQGGSADIDIDIEADMPVTTEFKPLKHVNVAVSGTVDPSVIAEVRDSLFNFFTSISVMFKPQKDKLFFDHGPLIIYGNESVPPGIDSTKFKPKPGC